MSKKKGGTEKQDATPSPPALKAPWTAPLSKEVADLERHLSITSNGPQVHVRCKVCGKNRWYWRYAWPYQVAVKRWQQHVAECTQKPKQEGATDEIE
jgi:hypothetical protein